MQRTVIHIHREAAPKPPTGQPCNGCGVCCIAEPCPVGVVVTGHRRGSCGALIWHDADRRYRCGVVSEPERYIRWRWLAPWVSRAARRFIAAGKGCDCSLTVETA